MLARNKDVAAASTLEETCGGREHACQWTKPLFFSDHEAQ